MDHHSMSRFAVLALALAAPLSSQRLVRGVYEDEALGFKLRLPAKWEVMPLPIDERWIVAQFLCEREYVSKSRTWDELEKHRPVARVIHFSDAKREQTALRASDLEDENLRRMSLPYRGYEDYLERQRTGFFVETKEVHPLDDVLCTRYLVRLERSGRPSKRVMTWVFHGETDELAVEFEVLEDWHHKLGPVIVRSLQSFRRVRSSAEPAASTARAEAFRRDEWRELSAEDRRSYRMEVEGERARAVAENLPAGWRATQSEHYTVISHADAKFTKRVVKAAEACRKWLDEQLGDMSDDYVMRVVIRICRDRLEREAYAVRSAHWDSFSQNDREVVICQPRSGGTEGHTGWTHGVTMYGELFVGLLDLYLFDKDYDAHRALPAWFYIGMRTMMARAKVKNGRLELTQGTLEKERVAHARRSGELMDIRELMALSQSDLASLFGLMLFEESLWYEDGHLESPSLDQLYKLYQLASLVRFAVGPGAKKKPLKQFLRRYAMSCCQAYENWRALRPAFEEVGSGEAVELRAARDRANRDWKRESFILDNARAMACNWSDREWDALDRAYLRFLR